MQRITTRFYRLSKAFAFFYPNNLSMNDREFLQRLVLTLYNQQSDFQNIFSLVSFSHRFL